MSKKFVFDDALNHLVQKITARFSEVDTNITESIGEVNESVEAANTSIEGINGSISTINETLSSHTSSISDLEANKFDKAGGEISGEILPQNYVTMRNGMAIRCNDTDGTSRSALFLNANNNYIVASGAMSNSVYIGSDGNTQRIYLRGNGVTTSGGVSVGGDLVVSGDIWGTTTGNALPISTDEISASALTVSGNANANTSVAVTKKGMTPIGIIGFRLTGTNSANCSVSRAYVSGGTAYIYVRNNGSSNATVTATFTVLYQTSTKTVSIDV